MITVELPWPPPSLSGHANGHWRTKSLATGKQRREAYALAVAAAGQPRPTLPASGDIAITITFIPPDRRGDRVNFPNRVKGAIDGIAQALGVNDARFVPRYIFSEPARPGRVVVKLEDA